jgi:hypothetical protein
MWHVFLKLWNWFVGGIWKIWRRRLEKQSLDDSGRSSEDQNVDRITESKD